MKWITRKNIKVDRVACPMAISGLFTFAWTTGQMFELVGFRRKLSEDLASLHKQRKVSRIANAEKPPIETKATAVKAHLSPEQRLKLWQEIEAKLHQLHEAEKHDIAALQQPQHDREGQGEP